MSKLKPFFIERRYIGPEPWPVADDRCRPEDRVWRRWDVAGKRHAYETREQAERAIAQYLKHPAYTGYEYRIASSQTKR